MFWFHKSSKINAGFLWSFFKKTRRNSRTLLLLFIERNLRETFTGTHLKSITYGRAKVTYCGNIRCNLCWNRSLSDESVKFTFDITNKSFSDSILKMCIDYINVLKRTVLKCLSSFNYKNCHDFFLIRSQLFLYQTAVFSTFVGFPGSLLPLAW